MDWDELREIVFSTLELYGKGKGRQILYDRLNTDAEFKEAAMQYGFELSQAVGEA